VGTQLNVILDLAKPRTSSVEDEHGTITSIPDERPYGQRMHDGLDEACGKLLKSADQPQVGVVPASVIITVSLEDLLGKTGLAETSDGSVLTADQLLRIADEAEIWPTHHQPQQRPTCTGENPTVGLPRPNHGVDR
jgi:hypothetical protein